MNHFFSWITVVTLMRQNHWKWRKNVRPSTPIKLIHFTDQYQRPGPC